MTFINDTLESVALPTHVEIAVVHRAGRVSVGEAARTQLRNFLTKQENHNLHKWLGGVLGLVKHVIETGGVVIHLVEDTGNVDREVSRAVTAVWPSSAIRDVRLMVRRVGILPVPAALEVLDGKT